MSRRVASKQRVVRIDLAGCRDKAALLARVAAALEFPDWFGHNWDALADCLADLGWLPEDDLLLLLENVAGLRAAAPVDYKVALEILAEVSGAWHARGRAFEVAVMLEPALPGPTPQEEPE